MSETTIKSVIKRLERFAPLELQEEWDNSGIKLGDVSLRCTGVMVTLDTTEDVVNEAVEKGCNLIIEHHPSIFAPIKRLDYSLPLTKAIVAAIKHDICIYSAHTNFDFAPGGLNDFVAEKFLLSDVRSDSVCGVRVGELKTETTLAYYAEKLKEITGDKNVTTVGDPDMSVKTVAVVNGGALGSTDYLKDAVRLGADIFVSGDIKYHVARFAKDSGYGIIVVGHYESESFFSELVKKIIDEGDVKVFKAAECKNPFNY